MIVTPYRTRRFLAGDKLAGFITAHVPRPPERTVVVVTSKIVALSQKRVVENASESSFDRTVRAESDFAVKTPYTWLTLKDHMLLASAGVDKSNAGGQLILLPRDSFSVAAKLRTALKRRWRRRNLGVLITDSRLLPLRAGVLGIALGYAGFQGLRDYRGQPDLDGRPLRFTETDVADSLATAAVLTMGEGKERQPLALVTQASVEFVARVNPRELIIDPADDIFRPLFGAALKRRARR